MATYNEFANLEICTGTIMEAEVFIDARKPAYQLKINFGEKGIKKSSAQITKHYSTDELIGKQIIAVINFPAKQIGNFFSECLVLGVVGKDNEVTLLVPDRPVENGLSIA